MSARIVDLEVHRDARGDVRETYRASWGGPLLRQMTATTSEEGALRGMHYHERQTDVWYFATGRALVQLFDPTTGVFESKVLMQGRSLIIPPRIAHGWQALETTVLIYGLDAEYDGSDEHGFYALDDGYVGASLWLPTPLLSDRDRNAPTLADFRSLSAMREVERAYRQAAEDTITRYEPALRRLANE